MSGERADSKIPLVTIIMAGIGVGAYLLYQGPLKSSRPLSEGVQTYASAAVDARLWEDPLAAVEAHAKQDGFYPDITDG